MFGSKAQYISRPKVSTHPTGQKIERSCGVAEGPEVLFTLARPAEKLIGRLKNIPHVFSSGGGLCTPCVRSLRGKGFRQTACC